MRERLAVARGKSNITVCATEANSDALGVLLLRAIDNSDTQARRQAKWMLARSLAPRGNMVFTRSERYARDVLVFLADPQCRTCQGQQFVQ